MDKLDYFSNAHILYFSTKGTKRLIHFKGNDGNNGKNCNSIYLQGHCPKIRITVYFDSTKTCILKIFNLVFPKI